jgi:predicted SAM-dependent methyltransferase
MGYTKLNLGCAHWKKDGWTNIDIVDWPEHPDIVADVTTLEFAEIEEIYAGHLLEHLEDPLAALRQWYSWLKTGGKLGVVVPDVEEVEMWLAMGRDTDWLRAAMYDEGHKWYPTKVKLRDLLIEAGFEDLVEIDRFKDWRLVAGAQWQVGFDCVKP